VNNAQYAIEAREIQEKTPEVIQHSSATPAVNADRLLELAITNNVGMETLERLMAMRDKLCQEAAERHFLEAMAGFQGECPIIHKSREVKGNFSFTYAPMDEIVSKVQPILKKWGLSYTVDTEFGEGWLASILTICHVGGHKKQFRFQVPIDKAARMNDTQKFGSARTYSQRYAFCGGFGIITSDHDDDGQAAMGGARNSGSAQSWPQMPKRKSEQPAQSNNSPTTEELAAINAREAMESTVGPDWNKPGWKQVVIADRDIKEGVTNGRSWTRYGFQDSKGVWYGTYSETTAQLINDSGHNPVWIRGEEKTNAQTGKVNRNIVEAWV
jgi:hypothetical protein